MNKPKKLLVCLGLGFLLTVLTAIIPGSDLLSKIGPVTLVKPKPAVQSPVNPDEMRAQPDVAYPYSCAAQSLGDYDVTAYGLPFQMYQTNEYIDACAQREGPTVQVFPVAMVLDVLFWAAVVYGGTSLLIRLRNQPIRTVPAKVAPQTKIITPQTKQTSLMIVYIVLGGILGLGLCLLFAIFASYLVQYRADSFRGSIEAGDILSGLIQNVFTWMMLASAGLLAILLVFRNRFKATRSANLSILVPVGLVMMVQIFTLSSGLSRTQLASGPYDLASAGTFLAGWAWSFLVYTIWAVVMSIILIKGLVSRK